MLLFVNWFKLGLILKNIKDTSPDVVIINGPFLPINNEILKKGIIQYNLDFLNY